MAGFRVTYADGKVGGEYNHLSEVETFLHHSQPGWQDNIANKVDRNSFDVTDPDGNVTFRVSGPPEGEETAKGPAKAKGKGKGKAA